MWQSSEEGVQEKPHPAPDRSLLSFQGPCRKCKEKKRIGIKKLFSIEKGHIPVINLRQSQKTDKQNNFLSVPVRFF